MSETQRDEILKVLNTRSFLSNHAEASNSATTKSGDLGMTQLLFDREVPKWHPRIKLIGKLDSLSSFLNLCKNGVGEREKSDLSRVQEILVYIMGEIATHEEDVEQFMKFYHSLSSSEIAIMDELTQKLEASGSTFSGWVQDLDLHKGFADTARTFARQAEASAWELVSQQKLRPLLAQWLNRLSDYLWALSRTE